MSFRGGIYLAMMEKNCGFFPLAVNDSRKPDRYRTSDRSRMVRRDSNSKKTIFSRFLGARTKPPFWEYSIEKT
jgi:hypothetical protein